MSATFQVAVVVLWVFVLGIGVLVLGMIRRTSDVLERLETSGRQPQVGAEPMSFVPPFELLDADGTRVTSAELFVEPASLALFVEPSCTPCRALMEELAGIGERLEEILLHVIVSDSTVARNGFARGVCTLFQNGEATRAFSNHATPQARSVATGSCSTGGSPPRSMTCVRWPVTSGLEEVRCRRATGEGLRTKAGNGLEGSEHERPQCFRDSDQQRSVSPQARDHPGVWNRRHRSASSGIRPVCHVYVLPGPRV